MGKEEITNEKHIANLEAVKLALTEAWLTLDLHFKDRPRIVFDDSVEPEKAEAYREHIWNQLWQAAVVRLFKAAPYANTRRGFGGATKGMWDYEKERWSKDWYKKAGTKLAKDYRYLRDIRHKDLAHEGRLDKKPISDSPADGDMSHFDSRLDEMDAEEILADLRQFFGRVAKLSSRQNSPKDWEKVRDVVESLYEEAASAQDRSFKDEWGHVPGFGDIAVQDAKITSRSLQTGGQNHNAREAEASLPDGVTLKQSGYQRRYNRARGR